MAVIDLSQLPAPQIIEVPDFESLLAERKEALIALYPADEQAAMRRVLALESEPVVKSLQENTYREILLRQRINEAAQAVMVAYAIGSDLDQQAARNNVKRLTITPANPDAVPPVDAVMESDDALRVRVPEAFEGLSVAGPTGAYEFHAKSADDGYCKFPNGLILQWGSGSFAQQSTTTVTLPVSFPSAGFSLVANKGASIPTKGEYAVGVQYRDKSSFSLTNTGPDTTQQGIWWIALGI
ncbi:Baseplate assembly protein J (GpJ) [Pantoea vagans C9-1]|nr:Baseplate assembly protein J (GpJ) [Pantoea vagans C9-1]